jgi:hypothetical protein
LKSYLTADYEQNVFTLGQVKRPSGSAQIVSVGSSVSVSSTGESLTPGTLAGVVVGAIAGIGLIAGLMFWIWKRRRASTSGSKLHRYHRAPSSLGNMYSDAPNNPEVVPSSQSGPSTGDTTPLKSELDAIHTVSVAHLRGQPHTKSELDATPAIHELPAKANRARPTTTIHEMS